MNKEQTGEIETQADSATPEDHPARVMITIPTKGDIRPETALWLAHAVAEGPESRYQATPDIYVGPWPVDCMRNWLVRRFLESDNEYLFFLDSDCEPEPGTIRRLLDHDKAIVASVYPGNARCDSGDRVVYLAFFMDWSTPSARTIALPPDAAWLPDGLMEVDAVGGSGVLIKRHVLETMGQRERLQGVGRLRLRPKALQDRAIGSGHGAVLARDVGLRYSGQGKPVDEPELANIYGEGSLTRRNSLHSHAAAHRGGDESLGPGVSVASAVPQALHFLDSGLF